MATHDRLDYGERLVGRHGGGGESWQREDKGKKSVVA